MVHPKYAEILARFTAWATAEESVRSVLIVGSQARADRPADDHSDLDLVLVARAPERLIDEPGWTAAFGRVVLGTVEPTAVGGGRERRVLYEGGRDVDFAVFPTTAVAALRTLPVTRGVLARGFRVLLDKDGAWTGLAIDAPRRPERPVPDAAAFEAVVGDFWYHVLWAARKLARGETWTAALAVDGYLKRLLLPVLEWDAALSGAADVWHDGRFLDLWLGAEERRRLPATFARYDPEELGRALEATADLFSDVARRVAARSGYAYPDAAEAEVRRCVRALRAPPGAGAA